VPICYNDDQVALAQQLFSCLVTDFPIKYLGILLSTGKLPMATFQPLVDMMAGKLPVWQGRLMHHSGRLTLIKKTLAAILVYSAISHTFSPKVLKAFRKIFRAFLWSGSDSVHGSKCIVAWYKVQRPLKLDSTISSLWSAPCACIGFGLATLILAGLGHQCQ
jgi:hypothetical protein